MKLSALALSCSLLVLAPACDKHQDQPTPGAATTPPGQTAATKVTSATFSTAAASAGVAPASAATASAAGAEPEGMSCGNAEMKDGTCGGEGEAAGGGCSQWDGAAAAVAKRGTPTDAVWATIPVKGMSCGGCERRIIANLGAVEGILGVEADAELGQVRVAFAKGNDKLRDDARGRIAQLGYQPE